ncbi:MAG: PTPA-CTERM sorting domain-containing protein [Oscillatoriales cyanobacterium C42_A2020_001]|nr:PTPA-CTERM sorting domain-containing protein [Leptolyngbyaceae cyanobacterium C42_A2020_001]
MHRMQTFYSLTHADLGDRTQGTPTAYLCSKIGVTRFMTISSPLKATLITVAGVAASTLSITTPEPAQALDFTGAYSPTNFTLTNINADGFIDTSSAPAAISITGGNNDSGSLGFTSFLTTAAGTGSVNFNWNYSTQDEDAGFDPFGYVLNNAFFTLTDERLGAQSGNVSFNVALGDSFGFGIFTDDNIFGRGTATISNFNAPTATPIPTPALLPGLIGLGLGVLRKRNAVQHNSEV